MITGRRVAAETGEAPGKWGDRPRKLHYHQGLPVLFYVRREALWFEWRW